MYTVNFHIDLDVKSTLVNSSFCIFMSFVRFLNRLVLQPDLRSDATLISFLENPNEVRKLRTTFP